MLLIKEYCCLTVFWFNNWNLVIFSKPCKMYPMKINIKGVYLQHGVWCLIRQLYTQYIYNIWHVLLYTKLHCTAHLRNAEENITLQEAISVRLAAIGNTSLKPAVNVLFTQFTLNAKYCVVLCTFHNTLTAPH